MTLLFATQNQVSIERKVLQSLLEARIDGIITEGTKTAFPNPNLDLYRKLLEKKIPIVFINGSYPQLQDAVSVLDDNEGGGQMLVEYLAAKGHKKIGGIFKSDDIQGHGRYAGYAKGLQKCGLTLDDSLTLWYNTELRSIFLSDAVIMPVLQRWKEEGCTAIVCYNDEMACQLLPLLSKCGISVPQDISVVSFDNSHLCKIGSPSITSLAHPGPNVGSVAAEKLLTLMNGGIASSESLPWEIRERASG